MATKTSLEDISSFYLSYFVIIWTHPTWTKTGNYSGTKLVGRTIQNSPSCVYVLHKTLNLVISISVGKLNYVFTARLLQRSCKKNIWITRKVWWKFNCKLFFSFYENMLNKWNGEFFSLFFFFSLQILRVIQIPAKSNVRHRRRFQIFNN